MRKDIMFMLLEKANEVQELIDVSATYDPNPLPVPGVPLAPGDFYSHTFNSERFWSTESQAPFHVIALYQVNESVSSEAVVSSLSTLSSTLRNTTDIFEEDGDVFDKNWGWDDYFSSSIPLGDMPGTSIMTGEFVSAAFFAPVIEPDGL